MERRLMQLLDLQLVEAYLRLDPDQLDSKKIKSQFAKVHRNYIVLTVGEIVCVEHSDVFDCTVATLYTLCFDHLVLNLYSVEIHIQGGKATAPP
jgi:hypothetical protein